MPGITRATMSAEQDYLPTPAEVSNKPAVNVLSKHAQAYLIAESGIPAVEWVRRNGALFRRMWDDAMTQIRDVAFYELACNGRYAPEHVACGRHRERDLAILEIARDVPDPGAWLVENWPSCEQLWRIGVREPGTFRAAVNGRARTADQLVHETAWASGDPEWKNKFESDARFLFPVVSTKEYLAHILGHRADRAQENPFPDEEDEDGGAEFSDMRQRVTEGTSSIRKNMKSRTAAFARASA